MSEMPARDLRRWVKEELMDAIRIRQSELHADPDQTFDEFAAINYEVARIYKFLRLPPSD